MQSKSDILIIGGGTIALATAVELARQGTTVTVLCRNFSEAAVHAAAGMLAPQAEGLAAGPMLDLCLRSRALYPEWTQKLSALTGLDAEYWPSGILTPLFSQASDQPTYTSNSGVALPRHWLDRSAIHSQQPGLSADVEGGWWFPADAQVNNRALARVLYTAAQQLGVTIREGITVSTIEGQGSRVTRLKTTAGDWQAQTYLLATGAWSGDLLPIPVFPRKGQMLSVRATAEANAPTQPLNQVLFGTEVYIVPRQNGRIVIGATSEEVGFTPHNTPAGIHALLTAAMRLYPPLQTFALEECWWGFRPATPDELPILGPSPYENLILATGHYRNGILLAPITAAIIAGLILQDQIDPLLSAFSWQRFEGLSDRLPAPTVASIAS